MFTTDLISAGQAAGAITTIAALVGPPAWWLYRKVARASVLLHTIEAEFRPNGGSTLRDAISRLEREIGRIREIERCQVDAVGIAAFETDEAGGCVWASAAYLDLVDRPIADVRGAGWSIVIHQDDRERVLSEWGRVVVERRRFELSFRYTARNGTVIPVHVVAVPVSGGYYGVVRATTDQAPPCARARV